MKELFATGFMAVCLTAMPVAAHGQIGGVPTLLVLKEVVEALSAAGKALTSLTDSIAHLVMTGSTGYSYVAAERERNRLIDISARAINLSAGQNIAVVRSIDAYLAKKSASADDWLAVQQGIKQTLLTVNDLLSDVRSERSDFVLESAYRQLVETLGGRVSLLNKLSALGQPSTNDELIALRAVNEEYKKLIAQLLAATKELNEYLKKKPT